MEYNSNEKMINNPQATNPPPPYNPPPYSYGPQANPQYEQHVITGPPTIIHTAQVGPTVIPVVLGQQMGPQPANMKCKSCNHQIVTRVVSKTTMRTHLFALMLCLIGCWPCAVIPYCMDSCNNADHYCPNCNSYIGSYINY